MLEVARGKNIYRTLARADLTKTLPFESNTYDAVTSSGVFLQGHVGAECVSELARILLPGGFLVCTVRPTFFEATKGDWTKAIADAGMNLVLIDRLPYKPVPKGDPPFLGYFLTCVKRR